MQARESFNRPNPHALAQKMHHVTSLFEIHAQTVQRLRLAHGFAAACATIALHNAIFIFKTSEFFRFTITAMTVHLDLFRPSLYSDFVTTKLPLKAKAFGCAAP